MLLTLTFVPLSHGVFRLPDIQVKPNVKDPVICPLLPSQVGSDSHHTISLILLLRLLLFKSESEVSQPTQPFDHSATANMPLQKLRIGPYRKLILAAAISLAFMSTQFAFFGTVFGSPHSSLGTWWAWLWFLLEFIICESLPSSAHSQISILLIPLRSSVPYHRVFLFLKFTQ